MDFGSVKDIVMMSRGKIVHLLIHIMKEFPGKKKKKNKNKK
jgi:hypothetical protein